MSPFFTSSVHILPEKCRFSKPTSRTGTSSFVLLFSTRSQCWLLAHIDELLEFLDSVERVQRSFSKDDLLVFPKWCLTISCSLFCEFLCIHWESCGPSMNSHRRVGACFVFDYRKLFLESSNAYPSKGVVWGRIFHHYVPRKTT